MRIGVLTGGGDAPGLNAAVRAVVKTAILRFGWEVVGIEDGFTGLVDLSRTRPLTLDDVRGLLPRGGTVLGTVNRGNPFALELDGRIVDVSDRVLENLKVLGLDALVVIGGDGTLRIARDLWERGAPVIGVPKTIDNDVWGTDASIGFDTALHVAVEALDRLHTTAESHHRIMVVEVMGRNAGWIALQAGIAGGADVILIPEIPFDLEVVREAIARRDAAGRDFCLVVAAEGSYPRGGQPVYRAPGRLGGIGPWVAQELAARTGKEARAVVLGHLQRGGTPSPFDRLLGTRLGTRAVERLAEGGVGEVVVLRGGRIQVLPLPEVAARVARVDPEGEWARVATNLGICLG